MTLQRPPRDTRLDLVRGWLQLQIFASHAHGSLIGAWLITSAWGLSDSSEQFVFLSGFGLGSVYALKASRGGARTAAADLLRRLRRLHRTHLIVTCAFAAMVISVELAVPLPGEARAKGWGWLLDAPWLALPAAAALLYQPEFMGILPVFLFCMLLLPGFLWLVERFGGWALLPPALAYAAMQGTGWVPPGLGGTEIAFNPFAWQILFLLGAWFGRRALLHGRAVRFRWDLLLAALAVLGAGLWVRLVEHDLLPGPALDLEPIMGKQQLALPRLLHALSLAYAVAALVPARPLVLRGWAAEALAAAGRNSLNIFCVGLFLSYAAATLFRLHPHQAAWLDLPLVGGGALVLLTLARLAERWRDPAGGAASWYRGWYSRQP
jgi:hypothetical protein